jgi:hypothetical protein
MSNITNNENTDLKLLLMMSYSVDKIEKYINKIGNTTSSTIIYSLIHPCIKYQIEKDDKSNALLKKDVISNQNIITALKNIPKSKETSSTDFSKKRSILRDPQPPKDPNAPKVTRVGFKNNNTNFANYLLDCPGFGKSTKVYIENNPFNKNEIPGPEYNDYLSSDLF